MAKNVSRLFRRVKYLHETLCVAVESKLKSKQEIFGREMANMFQKGQPLPNLVHKVYSDSNVISQLKTLISEMTMLESNYRRKIDDVEKQLRFCEGNIEVIKIQILIIVLIHISFYQHNIVLSKQPA